MHTKLNRTLMLAAVTLVAAGSAWATDELRAKVPFQFVAGETTLPAGDYSVAQVARNSSTLLLRSMKTGKAILVSTSSHVDRDADQRARLTFHCNAGGCALVRMWDGQAGFELKPRGAQDSSDDRISVIYLKKPNVE
jgi:hypothetical protein